MKVNAVLLGKLIKEARTTENLNSAEFAKKANISPSALTRLENPPKPDFRVSYDTLVNALELVGSFSCVKNRDLQLDQYLSEPFAAETMNLFLMFAEHKDYMDSYIYKQSAPTSEYVYRHMADIQDSLLDALNNHFKAKEYRSLLVDACERLLDSRAAQYKGTEEYEMMKVVLPHKLIATEEIAERAKDGIGHGLRFDMDNAFSKLLETPSVEAAVMLAVSMMNELAG